MRISILIITLLCLSLNNYAQEVELVTQEKVLGVINSIKYSPDGKYIGSTNTRNSNIMIWDVRSTKLIGQLIGHEKPVENFYFSPDGKQVLSRDEINQCFFWDLDSWSKVDSVKIDPSEKLWGFGINPKEIITSKGNSIYSYNNGLNSELSKLKSEVQTVCIGKHDNQIYVVTPKELVILDKTGTTISSTKMTLKSDLSELFVSDKKEVFIITKKGDVSVIKESKLSYEFPTINNPVDVDFSSKDGNIAMIDHDGSIKVWDSNGQLVSSLKDENDQEKAKVISFNSNGDNLASTGFKTLLLDKIYSKNNVIQIWSVTRGNIFKTMKGNVNPIDAFAFSPADNYLYTLRGQQLDIWSLNSAQRLGSYVFPERKIEIQDRGLDNVNEKTTEAVENTKDKISNTTVTESKVNKWKAIASGDVSSIKDQAVNKIEEKKDAAKTYAKEESKLAGKAAFSRFGFQEDKIIISPQGNYLLTVFKNDEIRLYSLQDGLPTYIDYVKTGQKEFYDIIFDQNEEFIAVGGSGKTPMSIIYIEEIQNTTTNQLEVRETEDLKMKGMFQVANAITLSNDGRYLVTAFNTGRIVAWRTSGWYKVLDFNPKITMTRKPFIGFNKEGNKLFVNTGLGVYSYDFESVLNQPYNSEETLGNITGIKKAKVEGFPVMTHMPLDYVITIADNEVNFMDIQNDQVLQTQPIPCNLVTDVQVNKFGYVGVSLKNGSLNIFDPSTGKERFVMVGENENAIFKTPDQYYKITKEGQELVTFKIGSEAYPFEQFDAKYNRPDIVLKAMNSEDAALIELYEMAYHKRLNKLGLNEKDLGNISALPSAEVLNLSQIPLTTNNRELTIDLKAFSTNADLSRLKIWNNDVPVYGIKGKEISGQVFEEKIVIPLASGHNKIQVAVASASGLESLKETTEITCLVDTKPNLYLVSIGTSKYKDARYNLNYAAKDAADLAKVFGNSRDTYQNIYTKVIADEEVTINNISAARSFIEKASIDDVVMIFVAGHGLLDANYDYYYGTHDVNFNKPSDKGLAYQILESLLDNIAPLKRILIMDTCHSGEVEEEEIFVSNEEDEETDDVMFRAVGPSLSTIEASPSKMMKELFTDLRRGTGATVLSSAGGAEFAMESSEWKNGLFTYSLLFGLRNGTADLNNDGKIMLSELQIYVSDMVTKLSQGKQTPTARIQNQELDYPIW